MADSIPLALDRRVSRSESISAAAAERPGERFFNYPWHQKSSGKTKNFILFILKNMFFRYYILVIVFESGIRIAANGKHHENPLELAQKDAYMMHEAATSCLFAIGSKHQEAFRPSLRDEFHDLVASDCLDGLRPM